MKKIGTTDMNRVETKAWANCGRGLITPLKMSKAFSAWVIFRRYWTN